MHVEKRTLTITTDASGDATAYMDAVNGVLDRIQYVKNNYDNGVDVTVTLEDTGETLWAGTDVNASTVVAPRQAVHTTAGAAALYAAGGVAVLDRIAVNGRIKFVIAQGGNAKSGSFVATII